MVVRKPKKEAKLSRPRAHARTRPPKEGLSTAEAARHFDVSDQTIRNWEHNKWVIRFQDRSIDVVETAKLVDRNRHPLQGGKADRGIGAPQPQYSEPKAKTKKPTPSSPVPTPAYEAPSLGEGTPVDDDGGVGPSFDLPEGMTLAKAREVKEYWLGERARLDTLRVKGELVPLDAAKKAYTDTVAAVLAALESVPLRVAPLLAGLRDQQKIRNIVAKEITSALRALSNEPPTV